MNNDAGEQASTFERADTPDQATTLYIQGVLQNVSRTMFGMLDIVKLSLVALYTGGHVLLEGNPGLGKTMLVRELANCLGFGNTPGATEVVKRWGRIQFTPDLMPADITGTEMPVKGGDFRFHRGPIFTWLLLADEINRATPKTQSAMLEAMAERQVTVLGTTHRLDEPTQANLRDRSVSVVPPFIVFATQNPIDHEGTHELPEAQSDRFMFKIRMDMPDADTLKKIMRKEAGPLASPRDGRVEEAVARLPSEGEALMQFKRISERIEKDILPMALVQDHIVNIVLASNSRFSELKSIPSDKRLKEFVADYLMFGLGPRAAIALMLGAKGWSFIDSLSRNAPLPADGQHNTQAGLFKVVLPVLRHRLRLRLDWESRFRRQPDMSGLAVDDLHDRLLQHFVRDTAPNDAGYIRQLNQTFELR